MIRSFIFLFHLHQTPKLLIDNMRHMRTYYFITIYYLLLHETKTKKQDTILVPYLRQKNGDVCV